MCKRWTESAWDEYVWAQEHDRRLARKVNEVVKLLCRNSEQVRAKPLRHMGPGRMGVRLDKKNRLVYVVDEYGVLIESCLGHYED